MNHAIYIAFFFALGACVGSFLNVVVWRLPRGESLVTPPSNCPKCNTPLKWYDNLPIVGWIKLGGRCRHCKNPISPRYPIVEAVTALLFVFFYVMFFILQVGPCAPVPVRIATSIVPPSSLSIERDWAMYLLCMAMLSALLAASLIDAELFIIPIEIPWLIAAIAVLFHALMDQPTLPGALNLVDSVGRPTVANALAAGGGVGLAASLLLWWRGVLPTSFAQGEPMLEVDREALLKEIETAKREGRDEKTLEGMSVPPTYDRKQIRGEIRKEMIFLLPPMTLAVLWLTLTLTVPPIRDAWASVTRHAWATGLLGSVFGGLIGGAVVWLTRILGTLGFGRVAMGLGDVHLMVGVGAVIGAGPSTVAFFLAPFCGIAVALYLLITGHRREIPYGPYLSMGTAAVLLFYCPIAAWLAPGLAGLRDMLLGRL